MAEHNLFERAERDGLLIDLIVPNDRLESIDVDVQTPGGEIYHATFHSYEYVLERLESYTQSGENLSGRYFWSPYSIILRRFSKEEIVDVVVDLWRAGMLPDSMERSFPPA